MRADRLHYEVTEIFLKRIAYIIGPNSAAQMALDKIASIRAEGGEARCFQADSSFVVERIPATPEGGSS